MTVDVSSRMGLWHADAFVLSQAYTFTQTGTRTSFVQVSGWLTAQDVKVDDVRALVTAVDAHRFVVENGTVTVAIDAFDSETDTFASGAYTAASDATVDGVRTLVFVFGTDNADTVVMDLLNALTFASSAGGDRTATITLDAKQALFDGDVNLLDSIAIAWRIVAADAAPETTAAATTTTAAPHKNKKKRKGLSTAELAGICVGAVMGAFLVGAIIWLLVVKFIV